MRTYAFVTDRDKEKGRGKEKGKRINPPTPFTRILAIECAEDMEKNKKAFP